MPEAHTTQADYEVDVIVKMGFPGYFLVTADLCKYAKSAGIRVGPGRGSAAGSLVAYALRITDLDPIKHKLLFERFLNPERISMPDIDLDFDERRRGDMIRYATEKYGEERVSQIITYGTIKAKAAVKDAARVLGFPYATGDKITKAMPPAVMGKDIPLSGIFDPTPQALRRGRRVPRALRERPRRQGRSSTPPAGSRGSSASGACTPPASSCAASRCSTSSRSTAASRTARSSPSSTWAPARRSACSRWTSSGLRNLTVLDDCLKHIEANRGETVVLEELDEMESDPTTYELLARGDTLGVFQLDGGPMRALLRSMQPDQLRVTSPPCSRSTGRVRWAPTRTTTTPTARTAASRSCRSTPSSRSRWPRSSATPTG